MDTTPRAGRQINIRGHQVFSHTFPVTDGGYRCHIYLLDPYDEKHDLRVFQAFGDGPGSAEAAALADTLVFLEIAGQDAGTLTADRSTVWVGGRWVDIFCDTIGEGSYQAFPFERQADGTRSLIMQFHLKEAVTAPTPTTAVSRCIRRLQDYFASLPAALGSKRRRAARAQARR